MGASLIGRRALLQAGVGLAAFAAVTRLEAMGRLPIGGRMTLRIPHDTSRLDPHDLCDPMAALTAHAVFDTVYSLDGTGNVYASLADGLPRRDGKLTRVTLREGLRSARGRGLDARDLVQSIERARRMGAVAVLADIPGGTVEKTDVRTAIFKDTDPSALAHALTSPVLALVSRAHSPAAPDGTGAFRAEPSADKLTLVRNKLSARGPSCLEEVVLQRAPDLLDPVRAFESLAADVAWLGSYIHQPRPGAVAFDLGAVAWVVLRTGNEAAEWGVPGVGQKLADAIPPGRLAHLALGRLPQPTGSAAWGGPACDLVASASSPHLMEIARSVASILSSPGHEVTASGATAAELTVKRRTGAFSLMLDLVRPVGPAGIATLLALATADQGAGARAIARHPPRLGSFAPRVLARTLRLGVIGELRVSGSTIPQLHLAQARDGNGWDLGGSYRN